MPAPAALALAGDLLPATHASLSTHVRAVDGLEVFFREAGSRDAPTLLVVRGKSDPSFETAEATA